MKKLRFVALLLVAMLAASACVSDTGNVGTDSQNPNDGATDELGLPAELDFTGETFRLISGDGYMNVPELNQETKDEEHDGTDIIGQAKYKQFINTAERLGVDFEFYVASHFDFAATWVYTAVNSWSDEYDAVFTVDTSTRTMAEMGFFKTVAELPYVNLDNPWWSKDYIESVSLNPHDPYILFGSITYNQAVERISCIFFNKRLLEEIHGMKDTDIYELVLDGKWTIDKFLELAKGIYIDNGNGIRDEHDVYGFIDGGESLNTMVYSSGLDFTGRDENGFPTLQLNNERSISLAEKLLSLSKDVAYYDATKDNDEGLNFIYSRRFAEGRGLFLPQRFFSSAVNRDMEDDFGMVPMPKYDEDIEGYRSIATTYVNWGTVPVTCERVEMTSAVLESLAYEGYKHVVPAYFENTLKLRYTRGDLDYESQMLDLIVEGVDTDFIYANSLGGLGNIFKEIFKEGENIFASTYDSYAQVAQMKLDKLIEAAGQ